jgi:hypothetical protein
MATRVRCANGHHFEVGDDQLGRPVRCPDCQIMVFTSAPPAPTNVAITPTPLLATAPASAASALPEAVLEEDDLPLAVPVEIDDWDDLRLSKPRRMNKATRMRLVRMGLALHYIKVIVLVLGVMTVVLPPAMSQIRGNAGPIAFLLATIVHEVLLVFAPILGGIGSLLCLWVPQKTGAKVLIICSFILDLLALLLQALAVLALVTGKLSMDSSDDVDVLMTGGAALLNFFGMLMGFAGWVLFMLFLRRLSYYFGDDSIGEEAGRIIFYVVGLVVMPPCLGCSMIYTTIRFRAAGPFLALLAGGLGLLLWLAFAVIVIIKLLVVIAAVREHLRART